MPTNTRRATSPVAVVMHYLLPRDRLLLQLLDVHRVFTTGQITTLLGFGSLRRCQDRLRRLHQLGLLERWRHRDGHGGSPPWRWTLSPVGMQLQAAAAGTGPPSRRAIRDRLAAQVTSRTLTHRIGVNQFFVDLPHSRVDPGARLLRWWPEQKAAAPLHQTVVPDGHCLRHADGQTTAWFLAWDFGTEFSGGHCPRRLVQFCVCASQRLTSERYRLQQVWYRHLVGGSPAHVTRGLGASAGVSHHRHGRLGRRADRHGTARSGHHRPSRGIGFLSGAVTATCAELAPLRAWYPCRGSCRGRCGATSRNGHRDRPGDAASTAAQRQDDRSHTAPRKTVWVFPIGGGVNAC